MAKDRFGKKWPTPIASFHALGNAPTDWWTEVCVAKCIDPAIVPPEMQVMLLGSIRVQWLPSDAGNVAKSNKGSVVT